MTTNGHTLDPVTHDVYTYPTQGWACSCGAEGPAMPAEQAVDEAAAHLLDRGLLPEVHQLTRREETR